MTALQSTRTMTGRDWGAIAAGFVGAFFVALGVTGSSSSLTPILVGIGVVALVVALVLSVLSFRDRRRELDERHDWSAFEAALEEGVGFDVPEGMGYASSLPAVLDDLEDVGQPADGEALHAIVGEEGDIHWCAFQHQREGGGTSTVGMVGLHPDRDADTYPHLALTVADPDATEFESRFAVAADDEAFADAVLHEDARQVLMSVEPFAWRLEGNQIITSADQPSTPEETIEFIEARLKPLAHLAAQIPLTA